MVFKDLGYYCIRMGNVLFHISKVSIDGKIKYRTTRILNNSEQIIKEDKNGSTENNEPKI